LNEAEGTLTFVANSSSGFSITFASMGYTFNANDVLEFTYWVDVETPHAVFSLKNPAAWNDHMPAPSTWGIGRGREYVLGDPELSVYDAESPRIVAGTWDPETSTGTFEVRMSLFPSNATAIGFQHNYWAEFDNVKVGESSEYTFKFISVKNNVAAPLATTPTITTQPAGRNIEIGTDAGSLTVVASAAPDGEERTYQWEIEDDGEWTAITGATTATLALAAHIEDAEEEGTWKFRVVVTNTRGESVAPVTSAEAEIIVYDPNTGPPPPPPALLRLSTHDVFQALAVGTTGNAVTDPLAGVQGAGGNVSVVEVDGKKAIRIESTANWNGLDLQFGHFAFQVGDIVTVIANIEAVADSDPKIMFDVSHEDWKPIGATIPVTAGQNGVNITRTLVAANLTQQDNTTPADQIRFKFADTTSFTVVITEIEIIRPESD
jgi:hypothetical protein